MTEKPLDTSNLKSVLDNLSRPGSLQHDDFLQSWVVQECLATIPEARTWPAEYLIGRALELQLQQWSDSFRFDGAYRKAWMEIFCLMAAYFRHQPGLPAYQKRPTLSQLGRTFLDLEELSRLVPGREHEADQLLNALDLKPFWYAFARKEDETYGTSTMDQLLRRAIAHLAAWLDTRTRLKNAPAAHMPLADDTRLSTNGTTEEPTTITMTDVLRLYREHVFPPSLVFVPDEWQSLFETLQVDGLVVLRGCAGSGKTHFLYALGAHIHQAGQVPLYVYLPDYAPFSTDMDILRFVAIHGSFGQCYRDERLQSDFEKALALAQQHGHLVVLADGADDLFEHEVASVAARLVPFRRMVVAERTPRLPVERNTSPILHMPRLGDQSFTALLAAWQVTPEKADNAIAIFHQQAGVDNLELLLLTGEMARTAPHLHIAPVVGEWIRRRLQRARSTGKVVDEQRKAQRLLQLLALKRIERDFSPGAHRRFAREDLRNMFWTTLIKPDHEDEGWLLIERCERAGLLVRDSSGWDFTDRAVFQWLSADRLIEQERYWLSWRSAYQPLLQWTAALVAHRAEAYHIEKFFERLRTTLPYWCDLAYLDLADVLSIFRDRSRPMVARVCEQVHAKLKLLAQMDSERLRQAAQEHANRAGIDLGLAAAQSSASPPAIPHELESRACDLRDLLSCLKIALPREREEHWLEDASVQSGFIEVLCMADNADLKWDCAAWLRRSSLLRIVQVALFPPRRITAWELLARIARDPQRDNLTRTAAQSVLMRDDLILRLWHSGEIYQALVYDLLLATGKRLHLIYNTSQWELVS